MALERAVVIGDGDGPALLTVDGEVLVVHLPRLPGEALRRERDALSAEAGLAEEDEEYYDVPYAHMLNFEYSATWCHHRIQ